MRTCLLTNLDLPAWEGGDHPGRWPYGLEALGDGVELVAPSRWSRGSGRADVALAVWEDAAHLRARLGRRPPPLVVMSCWLGEMARSGDEPSRAEARRLVEEAAAITVFSSNQVGLLVERLGVDAATIHPLTFGVQVDWYTPAGGEEGYVVAVGSDYGRDWATLYAAAAMVPDVAFRVVIGWGAPATSAPANVEVLGPIGHPAYRDLVRRSSVVCVPCRPFAYPTGQSALLEGYACGRPAVTARTDALDGYTPADACLTYLPGDPASLAAAVRALMDDRQRRATMGGAARRHAEERFDARAMWARVATLLEETGRR